MLTFSPFYTSDKIYCPCARLLQLNQLLFQHSEQLHNLRPSPPHHVQMQHKAFFPASNHSST